jgi:hypothetical protein
VDILTGEERRTWILGQLEPPVGRDDAEQNQSRVRSCVPDRFEAYVKIFHPIYEDLTEPDRDITWDEWDRAESHGLPAPALDLGTLTRVQSADSVGLRRIRWRWLAEVYGLKFHPEFNDHSFSGRWRKGSWPKFLVGPAEGTLGAECAPRLGELLRRDTREQVCYFTFFPIAFDDVDHPFGVSAQLAELDAVLSVDGVRSTPEYWWPEDFSWCVCTDYDLTFTLVGCSRATADDILADAVLETIETRPEHRVDYRADRVNAQ